jgi:hypothetical protein
MVYVQRQIGKLHVRYNGYEFEFTIPEGTHGEHLSEWRKENVDRIEQLKVGMKEAHKLKVIEQKKLDELCPDLED